MAYHIKVARKPCYKVALCMSVKEVHILILNTLKKLVSHLLQHSLRYYLIQSFCKELKAGTHEYE